MTGSCVWNFFFKASFLVRHIDIQTLLSRPVTSVPTAINQHMTVKTRLESNSPEPLTLWRYGVNNLTKSPSNHNQDPKLTFSTWISCPDEDLQNTEREWGITLKKSNLDKTTVQLKKTARRFELGAKTAISKAGRKCTSYRNIIWWSLGF